MHWTVLTPFDGKWLTDFATDGGHTFSLIPPAKAPGNWNLRKKVGTPANEWREFLRQVIRAVPARRGGVITAFPQLALLVGLFRGIGLLRGPTVAWFFNTTEQSGLRRKISVFAFSKIDLFVVHADAERQAYSEWFSIPLDKIKFVPLQVDYDLPPDGEDLDQPFVFATGSGARDYKTFFEAMAILGYPTKVVAGERVLEGLTPPPTVEILDMPRDEIRRMVRRSRVNVIPMTDAGIVAGTITIVETLRLGRAVVITDRTGVHEYVKDGHTGLHARRGDAADLAAKIKTIWESPELRSRMNLNALQFAEANCTDVAAGRSLAQVLTAVATKASLAHSPLFD